MPSDQAEPLRQQARRMSSPRRQGPDSSGKPRARRIAVTSGKGGVGKSNVSLNMAIAFGKLGQKVLLVDADTNLANLDILLGLKIRATLYDVVAGDAYFSEVLVNGPEGIKILPGSSGVVDMLDRDSEVRNKLIAAFEEFERLYDIILIDTGAGLSENVMQFVIGADDVILVTNSEPTSITDAYAMIKVAITRNPVLKIHVLINLAQRQRDAMDTFEKLQLAVRNFLQVHVDLMGYLPVDPNVPVAVARQEPFITLFPRSPATTAMMMMARKYMKMPVQQGDRANFLQRIFSSRGEE